MEDRRPAIELVSCSCREGELRSAPRVARSRKSPFEDCGDRALFLLPAQVDGELDIQHEILDRSILEGLRTLEVRVGKKLVPEMVEIFELHASRYCEQIRRAFDTSDAVVLRQVSHKLKGSARTVGLLRLSGACAELEAVSAKLKAAPVKLEKASARTDWDIAASQVATIEREYGQAMTALRAYLDG